MFIGREKELIELNKMYSSSNFEFAMIYGDKNVGKTALLVEFAKDKNTIFYVAADANYHLNVEWFTTIVYNQLLPETIAPVHSDIESILDNRSIC